MRSGLMGQLEEEVQSLCGFNARSNALSQCSRDKPELGPAAEANSRAPRALPRLWGSRLKRPLSPRPEILETGPASRKFA
jgi:hypothetical protein